MVPRNNSSKVKGKTEAQEIDKRLRTVLSDTDPFWMRWRFVAEKKGWLE
jgi:hypothetical protein